MKGKEIRSDTMISGKSMQPVLYRICYVKRYDIWEGILCVNKI